MHISSRTPEGDPFQCEICGQFTCGEKSDAGDTLCPACGSLLWDFKNHLGPMLNIDPSELDLQQIDKDIAHDSIGACEVVMSIEDLWGDLIDRDDIQNVDPLRKAIALIRLSEGTTARKMSLEIERDHSSVPFNVADPAIFAGTGSAETM